MEVKNLSAELIELIDRKVSMWGDGGAIEHDNYRKSLFARFSLLTSGYLRLSEDDTPKRVKYSYYFNSPRDAYTLAYETTEGELYLFTTPYNVYMGFFDSQGEFHKTYDEYVLGIRVYPEQIYEKTLKMKSRFKNKFRNFFNFKRSKTLIFNNINIGHCIWNEQAGIELLKDAGLFEKINKVICYFDYFNMKKFFNEIKVSFKYCWRDIFTKDILFLASSMTYTSATRERLLNWVLENNGADTSVCKDKFVIGMSLRTHQRAWKGEKEGFCEIIKRLNKKYENLHFVIDGFCDDYREDTNSAKPFDWSMQKDVETYNQITEKVFSQNKKNLSTTIGMKANDKMAVLNECDLYITAFGSAEHVIWLTDKPIIVYGPDAAGQLSRRLNSKMTVEDIEIDSIYYPQELVKEDERQNFELDFEKLYDIIERKVDGLINVKGAKCQQSCLRAQQDI